MELFAAAAAVEASDDAQMIGNTIPKMSSCQEKNNIVDRLNLCCCYSAHKNSGKTPYFCKPPARHVSQNFETRDVPCTVSNVA